MKRIYKLESIEVYGWAKARYSWNVEAKSEEEAMQIVKDGKREDEYRREVYDEYVFSWDKWKKTESLKVLGTLDCTLTNKYGPGTKDNPNYKETCIRKLAKLDIGDSLTVYDRRKETVRYWILHVRRRQRWALKNNATNHQFFTKNLFEFEITELSKSNQEIKRIK